MSEAYMNFRILVKGPKFVTILLEDFSKLRELRFPISAFLPSYSPRLRSARVLHFDFLILGLIIGVHLW